MTRYVGLEKFLIKLSRVVKRRFYLPFPGSGLLSMYFYFHFTMRSSWFSRKLTMSGIRLWDWPSEIKTKVELRQVSGIGPSKYTPPNRNALVHPIYDLKASQSWKTKVAGVTNMRINNYKTFWVDVIAICCKYNSCSHIYLYILFSKTYIRVSFLPWES